MDKPGTTGEKFHEVMGFDLWDPPHIQGEDPYEWKTDFHFWYTPDPLEEEAINEKCCIEVLKRLGAKANEEIEELEEDKVMLQTQLALTNAKFAEQCFHTLREKIDSLETSIRSMKEAKDKHDLGEQLQLHKEPADKIQVTLKDLLSKNIQPKAKQDSISNSAKLRSEQLKEALGVSYKLTLEKNDRPLSSTPGKNVIEKRKNDDSVLIDATKYVLTKASAKSNEKGLRKIDSQDKQNKEKQIPTHKNPGNRPTAPMIRRGLTNPPVVHEVQANPPVIHEVRLNPPRIHEVRPNPPLIHEVRPNPALIHEVQPNPPMLHEVQPNPPMLHEVQPNPPMLHEDKQPAISLEKDKKKIREGSITTNNDRFPNTLSTPKLKETKIADTGKVVDAVLRSKSNVAEHSVSGRLQKPRKALEDAKPTPKLGKTYCRVEGKEQGGLHKSEPILLDLLSNLSNYKGKDASKRQIKVEKMPDPMYILESEPYRIDVCRSNLSLKRKFQADEPCLSEEPGLKQGSPGKSKRGLMSGIGGSETPDAAAPDAILTSVGLVDHSSTDDSGVKIPKPPSCPTPLDRDLEDMTLVQLRAIAKERNLRRYSNIRKAELLKLLGVKLQSSE